MPTIDAEVEFEVFCAECNAGLCHVTVVNGNSVYVEPCPNCIAKARSDGLAEGYDEGYEARKDEEECD